MAFSLLPRIEGAISDGDAACEIHIDTMVESISIPQKRSFRCDRQWKPKELWIAGKIKLEA